jgi:hypothetical protein
MQDGSHESEIPRSDRRSRAPLSNTTTVSNKVTLCGFLIAMFLVVIGYPLLNEQATGICSALEYRYATLKLMADGSAVNPMTTALARGLVGLSNGELAAAFVKAQQPNLPPAIGCTLAYWDSTFDPVSVQQGMSQTAGRRY